MTRKELVRFVSFVIIEWQRKCLASYSAIELSFRFSKELPLPQSPFLVKMLAPSTPVDNFSCKTCSDGMPGLNFR